MAFSSSLERFRSLLPAGALVEPVTEADVESTLGELRELQGGIEDIHGFLGRHPDRLEEVRPVLSHLQSERRAKLVLLGEQLLAWQLVGGVIALRPAAPAPAGEPARPAARGQDEPSLGDAERGMLRTFLDIVGPPRDLGEPGAVFDETEAIEAMADTMEQWPAFPQGIQRLLVASLVVRARAVRDLPRLSSVVRERTKDVLLRCPTYAQAHPLGKHVNGMQRAHQPQSASWRDDALSLWGLLADAACARAGDP